MFEKASRMKLRFNSNVGSINSEDLWDMKLEGLDVLAQTLRDEVKQSGTKSFIVKRNRKDTVLKLKFDIVKYVIETLLDERETAKSASANRVEKQKILGILSDKEDEDLRNMSAKDLKKMADKL